MRRLSLTCARGPANFLAHYPAGMSPRLASVVGGRTLSTSSSSPDKVIDKKSPKLWGGRFEKNTDPRLGKWTESISVDSHLVDEDLWGSLAHVTMLGHQGIIPAGYAAQILDTLLKLQDDWATKRWEWIPDQEDVHMNAEAKVIGALGKEVGGRMHTCRSRNDQVVTDSKLYARRRLLELRGHVARAVEAFIGTAEKHLDDTMVSYTHVQHAQPVSVAYWLSHYAGVLLRDLGRLKNAYETTDHNPLGSGAVAGTSFPIDRRLTSDFLGFQHIHLHAMDATASRDFMMECLFSNANIQITLSRFAEELILWSSAEFRSVTLSDAFAMGSSMMPQKKNPGALELMRGRGGRMIGYLTAGGTLLKGLPSAYNRDFHEDKELLVASFDLINKAVDIIPAIIETTTLNLPRMRELSDMNFATATELANYLVLKHNVPFRHAHDIVGSLVGKLSRMGQNFSNKEYCLEHIKSVGIEAPDNEVLAVLDSEKVMKSYNSLGGTSPKSVSHILDTYKQTLEEHQRALDADNTRVHKAREAARALAKEVRSAVKEKDDLVRLVKKYRPI